MLKGAGFKSICRFMVLIALVVVLAATSAGCGSKEPETSPPPVTDESFDTLPPTETPETPDTTDNQTDEPEESEEPVETPKSVTPVTAIFPNPLDTVSFYDENYYYAMNPAYKVWYIAQRVGPYYELLDQSIAHWAGLMNVEYGGVVNADDSGKSFLDLLAQYAADGADGLLIDPDTSVYARAAELLDEAGIPWMSVMSMPRDYAGENAPLLHPYITGQYQLTGTAIAGKLLAIKDELWPDVPIENIALLLVGPEVSGAVSGNIQEVADAWISQTGFGENCIAAAVSSLNIEAPIKNALEQAAEFQHYLIYLYDDTLIDTANNLLDIDGLAPNAGIVAMTTELETSRQLMFIHWENSQQSALKALLYSPATLRAEASLGALYAFMSGTASPETIWPSWINQYDKGGEDGAYASYAIPYFWLEHDNYRHILKWTDVYSGANFFPDYPLDIVTPYDYEQWRGVPEEYAG